MIVRSCAALAVFFLLCAGFAAAAPLDASAFSYNAQAPLRMRILNVTPRGEARSLQVTFVSGRRTIHAEIVMPASGVSKGPGVLFVHWLGDPATTNHREFEPDALALAQRGATCVLIDAMWSTVTTGGKDWYDKVRTTGTDYQNSIAQVIDLRRGLDLLLAQAGVDPSRIAYVGHDFGAMYGAVLAGVDPRPRYYILMAGTTTFSEWYLLGLQASDFTAYVQLMSSLDPLPYLSRSKAQGFMFQFASHDAYITPEHALQFFGAAPLPRAMFVYDAKHDLKLPLAMRDRLDWLGSRLF